MTDESTYQQFAWVAKYIRKIKPATCWLRIEFPPVSAVSVDLIDAVFYIGNINILSGMNTGVIIEGVVKNHDIFAFLMREFNKQGASFPDDHTTKITCAYSFDRPDNDVFTIDTSEKGLFACSIKLLTTGHLNRCITAFVEEEKYEEAAIVKAELDSRL